MKSRLSEIRNYSEEEQSFIKRAVSAFTMIFLLSLMLVGNIYRLQVSDYKHYQKLSDNNRIRTIPIVPIRGEIFDRNHIIIAQNHPIYCLTTNNNVHENISKLLENIKQHINYKENQVAKTKNRYNDPNRSFHKIILTELTKKQVAHFSVVKHKFPNLSISVVYQRYYPFGKIFTHALGYVSHINNNDLANLKIENQLHNYQSTKNIGRLGIERYYEKILHGTVGYQKVEVNSHGEIVKQLEYVSPINGEDIVLNLDVNLQKFIYKLLDNRPASSIVMDSKDNSVIAMVSSPSYDPNIFTKGISQREYNRLLSDPDRPLLNRATLGVYPPASTVKPFMAVAALQENIITRKTTRNDHGKWRIPGTKPHSKVWRDWKRWGHGKVNVTRAIEESVDSFFYQIAYELGIKRISHWMSMFGFGKLCGLDIYEETKANMPTREWKYARYHSPWYKGDTVPIGIGQGYWTATPMQIANATSILVNRGKAPLPHLLKGIFESGNFKRKEAVYDSNKLSFFRKVPDEIWNTSLNAMRLVNHGPHGSGRHAFHGTKYISGGKSGTAQIFSLKKNERYNSKTLSKDLLDHSLYTAFAPFNKPRFVATVVVEHGNGGAKVGAPFIRQVFDYLLVTHKNKGEYNSKATP
ncbi:penicillin-binding protein 2 [Photobacterium swingsii]|uniref:penicillin-binding protein 2 n=1 Tax=Photobacterium swingsii TaxID=680026 RepID=UPI00352ECC32